MIIINRLATHFGSLPSMTCSLFWFSSVYGLLRLVVLFRYWLARPFGSLAALACFLYWFSVDYGSLLIMVL